MDSVLPWSILTVLTVAFTVGFGYLFYKDRDKRKLMFMLAFAFASLSYLTMLTEWDGVQIMERLYHWSALPILSAVLIAVLSGLLKLKDFDKPFKTFLFTIATSIFMTIVPLPVEPALLFQGMAIIVISVSIYLYLTRREFSDLMFLLSMVCFTSGSVGMARDLGIPFIVFAYIFAYVFIALVFATSKEGVKGGIASFFALERELEKTREELRISQEQLVEVENIFAASPDAVIVSDLDGNVIECNQATLDMFGYSSKDEVIGKSGFAFIAEKDRERTKENLKKILEQGSMKNVEYAALNKDGREFPVEFSASVIKDSSGEPTGFVSVTKDITEYKQVVEALLEGEEKFHAISYSAKDAIILIDDEGRISYWNLAAEMLFGYTKEEAVNMELRKLFASKRFYEDYLIDIEKFKETGQSAFVGLTLELGAIRKDGTEFPIELSLSAFKTKDKWHLINIVRDITERKRMEKKLQEYAEQLEEMVEKRTRELRESEEKFKDVFKSTPDSIVIVDLSGNLFEFNETTLELFGYSREEILRKNFLDFTVEEDLEIVLGGMKQVLEKGFARIQFQISAKDERKIPVELNASVLKDPEGNRVGFVAVLRDITERKRMEEQLLKSERLAAIGQLATMVGHDLRNPLSAIQNACYYLKMKLAASKNKKVKKMFEVMDKEIDYANNITKDLLDLSRAKKPEIKELDLISSIQDALAQFKFPENIALTTKFSEVPAIEADPNQLRRVFQNIALNGAQAMPDGGELTVSTRKNGDFVEVAFTDTGVGISRENMDKLFTPLFTTKAQGVGLGLAICKKLIEGHNGRIEVKSKVGEGSTFTVKLPIDQIKGGEN